MPRGRGRGAAPRLEGFQFFGYSLGHYYVFGEHQPGVTDVWERFEAAKDKLPPAGRGSGIGTPDELRAHLRSYQDAGVDQVVFIQQGGRNKHEHICEALELFAAEVMPVFKADQAARDAKKAGGARALHRGGARSASSGWRRSHQQRSRR